MKDLISDMTTALKLSIALIFGAIVVCLILVSSGAAVEISSPPPTSPKTYYFTWYDSLPGDGMGGDWIAIGNLEDHTAHADVYFGTEITPRDSFDIEADGHQLVSWPNTIGGPVRVVSSAGDALAVTQRVIYHDTFNEVAAMLSTNLDSSYYFTWYDDKPSSNMNGNWIIIANEDTQAADVDVYIGSARVASYNLDPGQKIAPQFFNRMDGPVHVVSTNGMKLMASQRVLYKDSFSEVMGFPQSRMDYAYFFTWYDMTGSFKGNWIMISNTNDTPVHADVFVGNSPDPKGSYTVGPHQSMTPTYPGKIGGPVRVVCTDCTAGENILVSQRMLYKDSFEEVQGTPPAGLDTEMDFGWYDNKKADNFKGDWVMIANQGVGGAAVDVYIGAALQPKASLSIGEGGNSTPIFSELMDGPVRVISGGGKPLLSSQRTIYKDSFNELLGLPRAYTGKSGPVPPDLHLLKINTEWASAVDYANRQLSVDFRLSNQGQEAGIKTTLDTVQADNGVTVTTAMPESLGDLAGGGGNANFTVRYHVPEGVQSFSTRVHAYCYDNGGSIFYYPST